METRKFKFPLNIQLFADDGENGGQGATDTTTYSKEEYERLKASFDKTSSELANLKKEARAKLSEEEKRQKEQEEKDTRLKELEIKVLTSDMTNELMSSGLEKSSISNIVEAYKKGDMVEMAKVISTEISKQIEIVKKQAEENFQKSGTTPPAGDGKKQGDGFVQSLLQNKKTSSSQNARDFYMGKK